MSKKEHWNKIYHEKTNDQLSWTQDENEPSLGLITKLDLDKNSRIIDIGSGNSFLVDHLIKKGFQNITLLDISEEAIKQTQKRLANIPANIEFIVDDLLNFSPKEKFNLWHDRAVLHFLTNESDVERYGKILNHSIPLKGYVIISTFSPDGPDKCSGLEIRKYDEVHLQDVVGMDFEAIDFIRYTHNTPWNKEQEFITGIFERIKYIKIN